jgi:NAD(P)-dependent dehydrogenase (short-subunit alcohol dehydrogenase family)
MASLVAGKSVLLTGATGGIGYLAAEALARAGAQLYVHGRDPVKVEATIRALSALGEPAHGFVADLASLAQTAALASEIAAAAPVLDVVINNAAVGFGADRQRREMSQDGYELRFAVNYLAPFLLTELLLAQKGLKRALINVASIGQEEPDFEDLMLEHRYEGTSAYRRSKLALVMWTLDLAASHPELVAYALHPGTLLDTNMVRDSGMTPRGPASRGAVVIASAVERALGSAESGLYFDELTRARAKPLAYDAEARGRLRQSTLELVQPFMPRGRI